MCCASQTLSCDDVEWSLSDSNAWSREVGKKQPKPKTEAEKSAELTEEELSKVDGGWGKSSYYSYSEGQSASYAAKSSDKSD